jgi:hypothetical protein
MDYSKLSDFDINCEVLAVFSPDIKHMCLGADNTCFYDCGPIGDGWHQIDIPDYCNNPADAWPIIVGKKLSLMNADDKWLCVPEDEPIDGVTGDSVHMIYSGDGVEHENPLRAAMIVFLMMQESANVPANSTGSDT